MNSGCSGIYLGAGQPAQPINSFRATLQSVRPLPRSRRRRSMQPASAFAMRTAFVPGHIVASGERIAIYSSTVTSYAAFDPTTAYQFADDVEVVQEGQSPGSASGANFIRPIRYVYHGPLNAATRQLPDSTDRLPASR